MTEQSWLQGTVLIVDDNPSNLSVLSQCLEDVGLEVLVAQNGESALQKADYSLPDVIVLDVMMPGIDGFETCQKLKTNPRTRPIPVILMTALSDVENKVRGLNIGAVDYITKPFQQAEVLARINVHLKVHRLMKELARKNQLLKQEVTERTASEARLTETLEQLGQTQAQLVHSEKMSSLGQMVAGISHELNNPLGFITGNLKFLKDYTETLVDALKVHHYNHRELEHPDPENATISDIDYIFDDIPNVLKSIEVGTSRITDIVEKLRSFSYLDQEGKKIINLHESLDKTLLVISHRLQKKHHRPAIRVIKDYGDLPSVNCCPGQINQVFLNLINNSIEAFDIRQEHSAKRQGGNYGSDSSFSPIITLRTSYQNNHVTIQVIDNGPGISEEFQARIFDPFFTTKTVGKRVGLGLSVCYQIVVEAHHGKLRCLSNHQGTALVMTLPVSGHPPKAPGHL